MTCCKAAAIYLHCWSKHTEHSVEHKAFAFAEESYFGGHIRICVATPVHGFMRTWPNLAGYIHNTAEAAAQTVLPMLASENTPPEQALLSCR